MASNTFDINLVVFKNVTTNIRYEIVDKRSSYLLVTDI